MCKLVLTETSLLAIRIRLFIKLLRQLRGPKEIKYLNTGPQFLISNGIYLHVWSFSVYFLGFTLVLRVTYNEGMI